MKKEKYMDLGKIKVAKTYGHVYGDSIGTPTGRVVWVSLAEPKPGMKDPKTGVEGAAKYEVSLLLAKNDPNTQKFIKILTPYVGKMVEAYNKGKKTKIAIEDVLRDGDDAELYNPEKGKYWAGNWVVRARHAEQPVICSTERDGAGWKDIDARKIQGGMLCRCVVSPMITSGGQLTYLLLYVQLVKDDGERFGGGFDKKSVGGLLSGDDFDESEEVSAEDGLDAEEETEDESQEPDSDGDEETEESEEGDDIEDEGDDAEDEDEEELPVAPKKRGRPPGRKGKGALVDRL